jgi:uncharacterized iron-regulated membrane protein
MWPPAGLNPNSAEEFGASPSWINDMNFRFELHILLQELHRGTIIGLPGHLMNILGGLCLVFLSLSGIFMFLELLKNRRRIGKKSLFWGRGSGMLEWHRWLSSSFSLLLVYIVITGTLTSVAQIVDPKTKTPAPPPPLPTQIDQATQAFEASPEFRNSENGRSPIPPPSSKPPKDDSLATIFQELHAGSTFGRVGEYAMLLTGFVLIVLSISGVCIYLKMYLRRYSRNKLVLIWK